MNIKEFQDNFKIRYNTKSSPSCVFTGYPLFLLGDITYTCENYALMTTLSLGTTLIFGKSQNNTFSIQNTSDNLQYTCSEKELSKYHEENYAKDIFHLISSLYSDLNITGLNMLFSHDINNTNFQTYSAPLLTALSYFIKGEKTPSQLIQLLQNSSFTPKEYAKILSSLNSFKNSCILINKNLYDYQHLPLPLSDKKIIIVNTKIKNQHMSLYMNNAYSSYLNNKANTPPSPLESDTFLADLSKKETKLLSFLINEKKRINKIPHITLFDDFCNIIYESSDELLNLTTSSELKIINEIITSTHLSLTSRPLLDDSAFYCIVYDKDVDLFLQTLEKNYEKKAGYKPTFYICDTATGGLNLGIIH